MSYMRALLPENVDSEDEIKMHALEEREDNGAAESR